MATRRYKISRGETEFDIVEDVGAATNSDNIELTVDLAVSLERDEVLRALEMIRNHIISGQWPPA
jgi:hypothetical protein